MIVSQISNVGRRDHNEDSSLVLPEKNIFMVCDGVGGATKGEVASSLCCDTFKIYFSSPDIEVNATSVLKATRQTEKAFDSYFAEHENTIGMATTMTFLSVAEGQALVAHAGDSRVYHVRNGEILFATSDHSLVNEMLASGFITPEEAVNHPQRNHITRAFQGGNNQVQPDINILKDVRQGDYFLLCTDGVLESVSSEDICNFCIPGNSPASIISSINKLCAQKSSDNYTCIVLQAGTDEGRSNKKKTPAVTRKNGKFRVLIITSILVAAAILYFLVTKGKNEADLQENGSRGGTSKTSIASDTRKLLQDTVKPNLDTNKLKNDTALLNNSVEEASHSETTGAVDKAITQSIITEDVRFIQSMLALPGYTGCTERMKEIYKKINLAPEKQQQIPDLKKFVELVKKNCKL